MLEISIQKLQDSFPKPENCGCIKQWDAKVEIRPLACPVPDCEIAQRARADYHAYQASQRLRRLEKASNAEDTTLDESFFQQRFLLPDTAKAGQSSQISMLAVGLAEQEAEEASLDCSEGTVVSEDSGFTSNSDTKSPCLRSFEVQIMEPQSAAPPLSISNGPPASWLPGQQKKNLVDSGLGIICHLSRLPKALPSSWLPREQRHGRLGSGSARLSLVLPYSKRRIDTSDFATFARHEYRHSAWLPRTRQRHELMNMERVYPVVSYALRDDYEDVFSESYYLKRRITTAPWEFLFV